MRARSRHRPACCSTGSTKVSTTVTQRARPPGSPHPRAGVEAGEDRAERDERRPQPHDEDGPALGVADLQQPVVQVLLVRARTASGRPGCGGRRRAPGRPSARSGSRPGAAAAAASAAGWPASPPAPWLISVPENWPVRVSALAESTSPISIEPLSPMNSRAGWKLCGRKPAQAPASAGAEQGARGRQRDVVEVGQLVAEDEERHRADADHAGGEAVEAVDEVHRVHGRDHDEHRQQRALGRVEGELAAVRESGRRRTGCPKTIRKPAASTCPPSLVSASSSKRSSRTPTAQISAPGDQHDAGVAEDERAAGGEERQLPGHDVRRDQPAEHRQPAEVRDRLGVHVAVAHLGHRPGAQRDLAGDDASAGRSPTAATRKTRSVLPHRAVSPRPSAWRPRGSRTALRSSSESAPRRSTRPWVPVTSTIVEASPPGDSAARRRSPRRPRPASPRPGRRRWRRAGRCGWPS